MVVAAISPPDRARSANDAEEQSAAQKLVGQPSPSPSASPSASASPSSSATSPAPSPVPNGRTPVAQRGGNAAEHAGSPAPARWHWRALADFAGTGDVTTGTFGLRPEQNLRLRWTFSCPSRTQPGAFGIQAVDAATGSIDGTLDETGAAGRGTTVVFADGASYHLVVNSSCTWVIRAVQRS